MSQKEMERLADAVRADKDLQEGIKKAATSNEVMEEFAKSRGCDISADEMLDYIQARKDTLTMEDLDKVAGGKGRTSGLPTDPVIAPPPPSALWDPGEPR